MPAVGEEVEYPLGQLRPEHEGELVGSLPLQVPQVALACQPNPSPGKDSPFDNRPRIFSCGINRYGCGGWHGQTSPRRGRPSSPSPGGWLEKPVQTGPAPTAVLAWQ